MGEEGGEVKCDTCPEKEYCMSDCDSMYEDEESVFDEDDHLHGDWLIDQEIGDK
jgi:hypothetical protein